MVLGTLMLFIGAQAQNANRSGVVVELGGGYTTGNLVDGSYSYGGGYWDYFTNKWINTPGTYSAGEGQGGYISLDAGYQWATARHFAVKSMATVGVPLADVEHTNFGVKGMLRYTSNDFGSGQSIYCEVGVGPKLYFYKNGEVGFLIAPEAGVGLNINSHLYLGLDFAYNIFVEGEWRDCSYGVPQLKVGYRF